MDIKKYFTFPALLLVASLVGCNANNPANSSSNSQKDSLPQDTRNLSMEDYSLFNLC